MRGKANTECASSLDTSPFYTRDSVSVVKIFQIEGVKTYSMCDTFLEMNYDTGVKTSDFRCALTVVRMSMTGVKNIDTVFGKLAQGCHSYYKPLINPIKYFKYH